MWNKEELWEQLADNECLLADGFDEAVIGITFGVNAVAVYSVSLWKMLSSTSNIILLGAM